MDTFWASKLQNYIEMFKAFNIEMRLLGLETEDISHHWFHFLEQTCDCEGCREDNNCVIKIDFE